jgi:DNA-binding MarR family transcriptional regulator/GNAT superfamily N-acetyltransferase
MQKNGRAEGTSMSNREVEAVRHFTRFYTQHMGILDRKLMRSPFSLSEARVLYEIAHHEETSATALGAELKLDAGYLSRLLSGLTRRGLIEKRPSDSDGRRHDLHLTSAGQAAFSALNARSNAQTAAMLESLSSLECNRLVKAMDTIEDLLGARRPSRAPYLLRPHRPGDMGWIVQRHARLYTEEYAWDETFEALVAEIASKFLRDFDPANERCWIAERDGENVGSILLVKQDSMTARIRLLLVDPKARGLGIGQRLVEEGLAFARRSGYRKVTLWTNDNLHAALRIYREAGFHLVEEQPHRSFGKNLVGQTWELTL